MDQLFYIHKRTITYKAAFWVMMAVTTLLRLFVIGRIGLGDDEGHYFAFSQNLQLSYFDHPPFIGYLIKIFTMVFGVNEFAVRLPAVILFIFTCYFLYLLAREMYDDKTAFWSVALMNVTPVFSFLGSVLTVPDAPLAFFWMFFIYYFWKFVTPVSCKVKNPDGKFHYTRIWVKSERTSYWYILGVALGFGLLSKYNMILLIPSALLFSIFSRRHHIYFTKPQPYLALMIAFSIFLPVLVWNIQNGFASFGYQLHHGLGKGLPQFSFTLLGKCLGAQAGYISPFLFFIYWFVVFYLGYQGFVKKDRKSMFLFSFSAPTLFLFNGIASFNEILPHWPATGYMVLTIGVAELSIKLWHKKWFRITTFVSWIFAAFLTILVPIQALYKILPPELFMPKAEAFKIEDGVTKAEKADVTNELYGWDKAGSVIKNLINSTTAEKGQTPFVFTHRHYLSSQLTFYVPRTKIYCLSERVDAYDFWQRDLNLLDGKDAIFVSDNRFFMDPTKVYPFKSWQALEPVEIFRAGRKIRVFYLWYGKEFDLKSLAKEYQALRVPPQMTIREGLIDFDHKIFWFINRDLKSRFMNYLMGLFSFIGNGLPLAVIVGLILWFDPKIAKAGHHHVHKHIHEIHHLQETTEKHSVSWQEKFGLTHARKKAFLKQFLYALLIVFVGGLIVQLMKDYFARVRPLTLWGDSVNVIGDKLYRCSFPSGHSQASFSAAVLLTIRFPEFWWVFFSCAFMVGISRVYVGAHFPIDVATGAFIGAVSAYLMVLIVDYIKPDKPHHTTENKG